MKRRFRLTTIADLGYPVNMFDNYSYLLGRLPDASITHGGSKVDTAATPTGTTFAEKLDRLFKEVRPLGREYTQDEVASAISAAGEISITEPSFCMT